MSSITMRSTLPALLSLSLALAACGGEEQPGALGSEGAHEHGVARVNVAVEGSTATIEFESPAMGIYGFEHEAVSAEDLARQEEGLETLRTRFASMFVLDEGLGCSLTPVHVGMTGDDHAHEEDEEHAHDEGEEHAHDEAASAGDTQEPTHAEVVAEFTVSCASPLSGSRLTFAVADVFPGIQSLDVQVLGDQVTGGRYQASGAGVEL